MHDINELQKISVSDSIVLRPLLEADSLRILEILNRDPSIRDRVTVASRLHSKQDIRNEIEKIDHDPELIRYVIEKHKKVVGLISFWKDPGFFGQPIEPKSYGFGFFLDPDFRGKGIITRSIIQLMYVAQGCLDVEYFIAFCEDNNLQSKTLLKKISFSPTDEVYGEPEQGWRERKYRIKPPALINKTGKF